MVIVTLATAFVLALPSCLAGSRHAGSYPWETHVQDNTFGAVDLPLGDAEYNPFAYGQANIDRGMYGSSHQQQQQHQHGGYEMYPNELHGASSAEWYPSQLETQWDNGNHFGQQPQYDPHMVQPFFEHDQQTTHMPLNEYDSSSYQSFGDPYGRGNTMTHAAHQMEQMSIAGVGREAGGSSHRGQGDMSKESVEGDEEEDVVDLSVTPASTRAPRDLAKAKKAKEVVTKEWRLRGLSCSRMQAPEIAAQVAEIKIHYPEYARSIGHLALQRVRENADPRTGRAYEQLYQVWTYTYSNRIKNLRLSHAGLGPEDLKQVLLAELRNVELIQGPPVINAANEEKQISIMRNVWYDFQTRLLDKELASGAQMSGHLIATLSQRYHYIRQTVEESMEYLGSYMSQVLSFSPEEMTQFYLVRAQLALPKGRASRPRRPRAST